MRKTAKTNERKNQNIPMFGSLGYFVGTLDLFKASEISLSK